MVKRVNSRKANLLETWNQISQARANFFAKEGYRKLVKRLKLPERLVRAAIKAYGSKQTKGHQKALTTSSRKIPNLIRIITQALIDNPGKLNRGNWILKTGKNQYRHLIQPTRPYQLWSGDWKEIRLPILGVTIYLFVILDCYTRQVMAFELSLTKDEATAVGVSQHAYDTAGSDSLFDARKLIMHTDQGSAYTSDGYINWWRRRGVKLSTADKGKPTQNPYIEAFFSIMVRFHLDTVELFTIADVNQSITDFIDRYNGEWLHSKINYQSPNQMLVNYRLSLKK